MVAFPPGTPFTLQETFVSFEFVTVATNVSVFPRTASAAGDVSVMPTAGRGGVGSDGGVAELAPPPPQPNIPAPTARTKTTTNIATGNLPLAGTQELNL